MYTECRSIYISNDINATVQKHSGQSSYLYQCEDVRYNQNLEKNGLHFNKTRVVLFG